MEFVASSSEVRQEKFFPSKERGEAHPSVTVGPSFPPESSLPLSPSSARRPKSVIAGDTDFLPCCHSGGMAGVVLPSRAGQSEGVIGEYEFGAPRWPLSRRQKLRARRNLTSAGRWLPRHTLDHCAVMLAARITLAHFSVSSTMILPNTPGSAPADTRVKVIKSPTR